MFQYNCIQTPSFHINFNIIEMILKNIETQIKIPQKGILNIIFISPEEIKHLNTKYRNKANVTDVLSFHYFEDFSLLQDDDIAGEIVFCEEKIISQAVEYGLGEEKEFYKLLIHSILHILGYDHEKDEDYKTMSQIENKIWQEIFEKR